MTRSHRGHAVLALGAGALLCLASAACRGSARAERASHGDGRDYSSRSEKMGTDSMTDGDIASIVAVANSNDSAGGADAARRATTPEVRAFGQRMAREHGTANRATIALVNRLNPNASPLENDFTRHMRNDAEHAKADLARDSGLTFDKAYIDHEVDGHQSMLNKLDHDLIPKAQNAQLKQLLTRTRETVNSHLQEAKRLQDALKDRS